MKVTLKFSEQHHTESIIRTTLRRFQSLFKRLRTEEATLNFDVLIKKYMYYGQTKVKLNNGRKDVFCVDQLSEKKEIYLIL